MPKARAESLIPALAHEAGNLLAAIRLSAHLASREPARLPEDARTIDALAAEVAALLELLRVLATAAAGECLPLAVAGVLDAVSRAVDGAPAPEVELSVLPGPDADLRALADPERLHHALVLLVLGALRARQQGTVELMVRADGDQVELVVTDDGAPLEPVDGAGALRGRPLCVELVREALGPDGGEVLLPDAGRARVVVRLPRSA